MRWDNSWAVVETHRPLAPQKTRRRLKSRWFWNFQSCHLRLERRSLENLWARRWNFPLQNAMENNSESRIKPPMGKKFERWIYDVLANFWFVIAENHLIDHNCGIFSHNFVVNVFILWSVTIKYLIIGGKCDERVGRAGRNAWEKCRETKLSTANANWLVPKNRYRRQMPSWVHLSEMGRKIIRRLSECLETFTGWMMSGWFGSQKTEEG